MIKIILLINKSIINGNAPKTLAKKAKSISWLTDRMMVDDSALPLVTTEARFIAPGVITVAPLLIQLPLTRQVRRALSVGGAGSVMR